MQSFRFPFITVVHVVRFHIYADRGTLLKTLIFLALFYVKYLVLRKNKFGFKKIKFGFKNYEFGFKNYEFGFKNYEFGFLKKNKFGFKKTNLVLRNILYPDWTHS